MFVGRNGVAKAVVRLTAPFAATVYRETVYRNWPPDERVSS